MRALSGRRLRRNVGEKEGFEMELPIAKRISLVHGHLYEDFTPGREFAHHWGRTILESDTVLFSAITMHYNPLYFNREYARSIGYDDIPVNPLFILYLTLGLSVEDLSEAGGPFLGCNDVRLHGPVYPGLTLYSRSRVLSQRLSTSRRGWGVVEWFTEGHDGQGRVLIDFRRRNFSQCKTAQSAAHEAPREDSDPPAATIEEDQLSAHVDRIPADEGRYFDDFAVGQVYDHGRGKTMSETDNYLLTHMTMNTAQGHFNRVYMQTFFGGQFKERLVMGGCTTAMVIGLTAQDMSEHALADIGYDSIRLPNPVFHGDTLHAKSEVLEVRPTPDRNDTGIMRYRATGQNQHGAVVFQGERSVLLRRRPTRNASSTQTANS
jgi:acyl dehydratase